ncbi:DUF5388 domain-containing protein [Leuconostoc mesenteroides]|uniref:DUF5388 domain-containing protein n=1 Tax=Leuconostoc mesenteroides TaxID=1245 RepID=UPI000E09B337|nr:DUF5388 domain-containing protein [Leuconostoc mesenteroides]MCM6826824.1 DUF5388 domain-containing protein [Leuconostoc mesenteroides]RDF90311.1 hypothetical protein DQM09_08925 [Leuconostoc mesenteroides subsp. mesenteroides]
MSLVRNNNKEKNKIIPRGGDIKPKKEFSIDELENNNEEKTAHHQIFEYIPAVTSIKVDTKIRDKVNTLSLIGYGENQKEVIENALDSVINNMSIEFKRNFENQYQVLENKTINLIKKKTSSE